VTIESRAELTLPADSAYAAVLRMTTAGLGARLDLTLDDIEDLRMAVSEACALILEVAREGGELHASYVLGDGRISVTVSTDSGEGELDRESFGWQVLGALTTGLTAAADGASHSISFTVTSSTDVTA